MSAKNTKDKIVTNTAKKIIIKIDEISKVLSDQEVAAFLKYIDKLKQVG